MQVTEVHDVDREGEADGDGDTVAEGLKLFEKVCVPVAVQLSDWDSVRLAERSRVTVGLSVPEWLSLGVQVELWLGDRLGAHIHSMTWGPLFPGPNSPAQFLLHPAHAQISPSSTHSPEPHPKLTRNRPNPLEKNLLAQPSAGAN